LVGRQDDDQVWEVEKPKHKLMRKPTATTESTHKAQCFEGKVRRGTGEGKRNLEKRGGVFQGTRNRKISGVKRMGKKVCDKKTNQWCGNGQIPKGGRRLLSKRQEKKPPTEKNYL